MAQDRHLAPRARAALRGAGFALALALGLRIVYAVLAALAAPHLALDPALIRSNELTLDLIPRSDGPLYAILGVWERFDTLWYLHIAEKGYDRPEAVVFYPLYPLLIRALGALVGGKLTAALLISTAASFLLFFWLERLLRLDLSAVEARRAVLACAVWPASFVFFAGYPDSLVTALIVGSLYAARRERWGWAGGAAFLAALTKAVGVVTIVPLALLAWRARTWKGLLCAACLGAPLLFHASLVLSGRSTAADAYGTYWRTRLAFPWTTAGEALHGLVVEKDPLLALNLGVVAIVLTLVLTARIRTEYTLFALGAIALFFTKRTDPILQSTLRYVLAVFPVYPSLARGMEKAPLYLCLVLLGAWNLVLFWSFLEWSLVV